MVVEPTAPLMNAHVIASEFFHKPHQEFMPHVSLVYGSYAEARKKLVIESLPTDVRTDFKVTGLILVRANSADPKDWHEIGQFSLKQPHVVVSGVTSR